MSRLLSTTRLFLAPALLAAVLLSACETSRRTRETSNPGGVSDVEDAPASRKSTRNERKEQKETADLRIVDSPNRLVAAVVESKVQYKVPREILMQQFNRQFDDGTVVDKALVRPIQSKLKSKEKPVYYLVGMGLRNGMFRAMALPLELSTDNELYLSTTAERYMLEGRGCQMCFFNFEGEKITGTLCDDNSGGGTCTLTVVDNNTFFPPKR